MFKHALRVVVLALVAGFAFTGGGIFAPASATYTKNPSSSWVPDGTVYAMATDGDRVYLGGAFTSLRNPSTGAVVDRAHIAALDAVTGELDTAWNPGADGVVRSLALGDGDILYAGGSFANVGG